jgi:transcriptional regulator with XRE-family HTH domain
VAERLVWTLGDVLSKARRQAGISVAEMAQQLGVSPKTINNIEHDRIAVRRAYIVAYSALTGIDPSEELAALLGRPVPDEL